MPKGPAARVGDTTTHPLPPVLTGTGSPTVFIGKKPAWRGIGAAIVPAMQIPKENADAAIKAAEAATKRAAGTPGFAAAKSAEELTKASAATTMGALMTGWVGASTTPSGAPDVHSCTVPLPIPPHGAGVVIDGSKTVFINGLPACRQGDTIVEAVGPPNKTTGGDPTVIIGG